MKKCICTLLAVAGLIFMSSLPGYAGHVHVGGSVWIGPGWGPWWGPAYPYYYPYPYYTAPPVVVQQSPQEYVQQPAPESQEPGYWYYCQDPKGYYPYVKRCPSGWLRVVPSPAPQEGGE